MPLTVEHNQSLTSGVADEQASRRDGQPQRPPQPLGNDERLAPIVAHHLPRLGQGQVGRAVRRVQRQRADAGGQGNLVEHPPLQVTHQQAAPCRRENAPSRGVEGQGVDAAVLGRQPARRRRRGGC